MKRQRKHLIPTLAALLAISLMAGGIPTAHAEDAYAMVTAANARVYEKHDLSGASVKLPRYMIVGLSRAAGGVSEISLRGCVGYIASSSIDTIDTKDGAEMVFRASGRVYEHAPGKSRSAKVSAGTKVNVIMTSGDIALVERGGNLGYTEKKNLEAPAGVVSPTPTPAPETKPKYDIVFDEYEAVVSADDVRVYAAAATGAKSLGKIANGERLTVNAYADGWAHISYNGNDGFCLLKSIEKYVEPKPKIDEILASSDYSSEKKIFAFLVHEMEFNSAAASGVLANVERESGFRATAYNSSGGSYGICQWTGGRKTALENWCAENGYDHTTLEGQLWYLKYELEKKYTSTFKYLSDVDDSAQGAYDAGYYWCYYFEVPANRTNSSIQRGNLAKESYWPKYR